MAKRNLSADWVCPKCGNRGADVENKTQNWIQINDSYLRGVA
jgi:predicted nucleic-acid-binding Zn-ribbon protein